MPKTTQKTTKKPLKKNETPPKKLWSQPSSLVGSLAGAAETLALVPQHRLLRCGLSSGSRGGFLVTEGDSFFFCFWSVFGWQVQWFFDGCSHVFFVVLLYFLMFFAGFANFGEFLWRWFSFVLPQKPIWDPFCDRPRAAEAWQELMLMRKKTMNPGGPPRKMISRLGLAMAKDVIN